MEWEFLLLLLLLSLWFTHKDVFSGSVTSMCNVVWVGMVTALSFHAGVKLTKDGSEEAFE